MPARPSIDDDTLIACLRATYGLDVTGLAFLPLGYDANAGVFRVEADEQTYFLKVRADAIDTLSVDLPHYLQTQGLAVVAPLPTISGDLWGAVAGFTLLLYPFIENTGGWGADLTDAQWAAYGAALKRLHTMPLPPELRDRVPRETFVPPPRFMDTIRALHEGIDNRSSDNPAEQALIAFWQTQRDEIGTVIARTERLSRMLRRDYSGEFVLCHADIHTGNLLIDQQGRLHIVDWDQPVLAPRERDLMFVTVGGFVTRARVEALIRQGYGPTPIDPLVMAYYRYERAMEDLADFARQVFLTDADDAVKQDAVYWFKVQFAPGGLIEAAHKLDDVLASSTGTDVV